MTDAEGSASTSFSVDLIGQVADWLMTQALQDADFEGLFAGCCERLAAAGIPLWRGHISFSILHPLYGSMSLTWRPGEEIETVSHAHLGAGEQFPEQFMANPLFHLIKHNMSVLRRRLTGDGATLDFPVLSEFRDQGATDYLAFLVRFGEGELNGMVGSWATDSSSGFSDADIQALQRIQQQLGVACKMRIKDQIARNVVTTYLGADAGLRVLNGQIRRGDGETIRAVIWYSDMRDSTELADTLSRDDYIDALNDYFEASAGAVLAHGGDISNFIGDAVLAIFAIDDRSTGEKQACERAYAASQESRVRLTAINEQRVEKGALPLRFGLGLHVGDVLFGNIGVPERVSFSVIGSTVNEVARLEALTKELDRTIVASERFAGNLSIGWESLGRHRLQGVGDPIEIFAPA